MLTNAPMKLYKVTRDADYGEAQGYVLWARSSQAAVEYARQTCSGGYDDWSAEAVARPSKPAIVMISTRSD